MQQSAYTFQQNQGRTLNDTREVHIVFHIHIGRDIFVKLHQTTIKLITMNYNDDHFFPFVDLRFILLK